MAIQIDRIVRSKRKTIALEITPDAKLIMRAPLFTSNRYLQEVAEQKANWIARKKSEALERMRRQPPELYTEGSSFAFLGNELLLTYTENAIEIAVENGRLLVPEQLRGDARKAVTQWYKKQALLTLRLRVQLLAEAEGFRYRSVKITDAKTRWGSCGPENTLNFTWRLVMAPLHAVDYVVVHELCHTQFHNHSPAFWKRVGEVMPDYQVSKRWLAENSGLLYNMLLT